MRNVFLTFTVFAMIVSITISVAHACVDKDSSHSISVSQQLDDISDNDSSNEYKSGDTACSGCCIHHIISNQISSGSDYIPSLALISKDPDGILSNLAYGLVRPPRI